MNTSVTVQDENTGADFEMPPLSSELFGSGKSNSFKLNESMDN